jgi:Spy/CpxP family protein refolding chaperone
MKTKKVRGLMGFLALALLSVGASFPFAARAHDDGGPHRGPDQGMDELLPLPGVLDMGGQKHKEGPCSELKLDADQKTKLRAAFFKFKDSQIDLEGRIKKAHLGYMKVATSSDSDLSAADQASKAVVEAVSNMMRVKEEYKNEISFKILRPEQRGPARSCEMSMKMHHFEEQKGHERGDSK